MTRYRDHEVDWGDGPGDKPGQHYQLLSPKAGETWHLTILHAKPQPLRTHYLRGRTTVHLRDPRQCEGCQLRQATRVKGFLGCHCPDLGRLVIAELSHEAYRELMEDVGTPVDMSGWTLHLSRPGHAKNGRVVASVEPPQKRVKKLPEMFDLREALLRIFNGESRPREDAVSEIDSQEPQAPDKGEDEEPMR